MMWVEELIVQRVYNAAVSDAAQAIDLELD